MQSSPKTLCDVLRAGTTYLEEHGVSQPRQVCEFLASRLLNCKRLELYLKFDMVLAEPQLAAMRRGLKRAAAGEPAQYITGQTEFMGRIFKVDRRALIPRPETETLVETVLKRESLWRLQSPVIADVGTGCGCIAVTLALERPKARCLAFDTSGEALLLAAENAAALGTGAALCFGGQELSDGAEPDSLDAIVANLPYVATPDWEKLPAHIRDFEPRSALDGGPDGLDVIRDVVPDAWFALKPGGLLFLEIGADQAGRVTSLLNDAGFTEVEVTKDLAGHDRIVSAAKTDAVDQ